MNTKLYVLMAAGLLALRSEADRKMEKQQMNTPTPAQALGDCLRLSDKATPGPWEMPAGPCKVSDIFEAGDWNICPPIGETGPVCIAAGPDNAAFIVALVNWANQHGQHFAGLEAEVERLQERAREDEDLIALRGSIIATLKEKREAAEARCAEVEQQLAAAREALQAAEARAAKAEQVSDMEWSRAENLAEDIEAYHMAMDDLGLAHRVDDIGRSLSMYGRAVVSMTVFATQQRQALINTAAELVQGIPAGSPQPTKADATLQRDRQP